MSYTVYMHKNKLNGKVYIGCTSQSPERRWQNGNGYKGSAFYNAIEEFGWSSFEHIILLTGLTEKNAYSKEKELIEIFDSTNPDKGYNIASGGKYNSEFLFPRYGKDNPHSAAVYQIDPASMKVIAKWETQSKAAKTLGIKRKGITKCCCGECKTYKGFIWEYADKDFLKPTKYGRGEYPHENQKKAVLLITTSGEKIQFESVKAAAEYVSESPSNISRYLSGKRSDKSERRWLFVFQSDAE